MAPQIDKLIANVDAENRMQVALEDFGIPGKKPTLSRASILTGLTRKGVTRLAADTAPERAASDEAHNRVARGLTGWARDAEFHARDGRPRALPPLDGLARFAMLVRRYGGDMPARAVLDELLRVGAVREREDHKLELRSAYRDLSGAAISRADFFAAAKVGTRIKAAGSFSGGVVTWNELELAN